MNVDFIASLVISFFAGVLLRISHDTHDVWKLVVAVLLIGLALVISTG